ncbi:ATP-binding protein [Halorubrum depositum]|uniref:ATP-binding protein n=1 Tax=Halorubrum depositum TaxID=2583992 RepID=UPI0011A022A1|nr:ATP-binding protein [Halorubrum depositum]
MSSESPSTESPHVELYEIVQRDCAFEQKAQAALELGERYLGVDHAHLTRIDRDTDFWQVIVSTDPPDGSFPTGLTLDPRSTYCRRAIDETTSLALHDAPAQGWEDDLAFETHGLRCYHGTPLVLGEDVYGTVCFVSESARDEPFGESDTLFAELIARLLERELERKRTEETLTLRANSISVLSRVLRHNLRNNMSVVRGRVRMLLDSIPDHARPGFDETILENIDQIIALGDKARKLEHVVSTQFNREPVALESLLDNLTSTVGVDDGGARLTVEGATDITLEVMPSLELALRELVENALTHADDPAVVVRVEATSETVTLSVIDNGPGLPEQERKVLDQGVETPLVHGSGLGLWMVHWIVTTHDGGIDTTVTDEGTTVTVTLPRVRADPSPIQNRPPRTLQHGRDQFEAVFEESFDAMVLVNDDRVIMHANEHATGVFGLTQFDLLGLTLDEFAGDVSELEAAWSELQATGTYEGELPMVRSDGDERVVEYSATADIVPGQHLVIGRDVTDRRERERAFTRSENLYRTLAENFQQGAVLVFGPDLRYQRAHGEGFEKLDIDPETVEGEHISAIFDGETLETIRELYSSTLDGESRRCELQFSDRDYCLHSIPVRDETGEIFAGIVTARDITEYKRRIRGLEEKKDRLEEKNARLEEQNSRLEEQNARLEEFASIVSHDLRSPLQVAESWLELTRENGEESHLEKVRHAHGRMEALIDDLLTIAREGKPVSEPDPVDLGALSERCWRSFETRDATLEVRTQRTIWADPSRLQQLLENLFRNAVEHGGEGVTVTVGDLDHGFYVADDGPGIPEEDRDDVFSKGYSTSSEGTGFGLAIVKEITEAHGWDIRVIPSDAAGTRIEVTNVDLVGNESVSEGGSG